MKSTPFKVCFLIGVACPRRGDPYENRTRDTAVKGRCLNRLTNGPYVVAAVGLEPTTCRV